MKVPARLHRLLLGVYQRMPVEVRRRVVRTVSPSYTVGAMCYIQRADGALLFVRHSYRQRWGVPGGLLQKGEAPAAAAVREAFEETGLRIHVVGGAAVQVDAPAQRVDTVFLCRPDDEGVAAVDPMPSSPEIVETRWFPLTALPELQFETAGALDILRRRGDLR